jgi:2-isopropylmalate synthase
MGVDIIEAGFPVASEAILPPSTRLPSAPECRHLRPRTRWPKGYRPRRRGVKPARRGRIHTFISTSPVHMKWKLQMEPQKVYELVISSVTRARNF